ncbi:CCHC-type domain-containing protein [Aphis craccivora]|uniref:CCHC-type domain-containing protein n=1 Tax=Aphis craccivora TaxID=307492 RepID=A0A6G0Y6E2_APHCR|nr:CCHC-type domain-containing protein [Aphis craccivora]
MTENRVFQAITCAQIGELVCRILRGKAPGPDGVPDVVIREIAIKRSEILRDIFNKCLENRAAGSRHRMKRDWDVVNRAGGVRRRRDGGVDRSYNMAIGDCDERGVEESGRVNDERWPKSIQQIQSYLSIMLLHYANNYNRGRYN